MANEENLNPVQTREEAIARGRAGGIASGKAKRAKKLMRETLDIMLSMPLKDGRDADVETIKNFAALKGKNISVQDAIMIAQIQKAMKGDTKAAEYVRDTVGQKPTDLLTVNAEVNNPFSGMSTDELRELVRNG